LREFYTHGKDWYLNGERVHFTFEWAGPDRASVQASMDKGITLLAAGIARPGSFLTMAHLDTPPFLARTCDELGMGLTYIGVAPHWLDLTDPEIFRSYTTWVREYTKWLRNHPSILFWCIGMNSPGNFLDFSPVKIGRQANNDDSNIPTTLAYNAHKEADPTRLLYFHGGPRSGDLSSGNIYFNHNPTQEVEDWLSEWVDRGDQPVIAVEFMGSPLEVDYLLDKNSADRVGFATEYAARTMGDAAYAAETDEYVDYVNHLLPRLKSYWDYLPVRYFPTLAREMSESHARAVRAWRFEGVPVFSWTFGFRTLPTGLPERHLTGYRTLGELELQASRPVQLWIGGPPEAWTEKDHQFFSGDPVRKSLLILHDRPGREPWDLAWEATLDGTPTPFASGKMNVLPGPWGRARLPFSFPAPQVSAVTQARITVTARRKADGTQMGRDSFAFSIHPRPAEAAHRLKVGVIDPEGDTLKWLTGLGVTAIPVSGPQPGLDALVVGRRALRGMETALPFTATDLENGLRVVIFEQHCDDLGKFGFRHEDRSPRQVFLRGTRSPLTRGLSDDMLRDWRGSATLISAGPDGDRTPVSTRLYRWGNRGSVASSFFETPHFGPFRSLIECEADLAYSPLLSFRHGRGEILYCQLDLTGRVGLDPAATLVAKNIVDTLAQPPEEPAQNRVAVALDAATAGRIAELGFASIPLDSGSKAGFRPDPKRHVLVLDGKTAPAGDVMESFVRSGGDVLVFAAGSNFLSAPFLGGALRCTSLVTSRAGRKAEDHPLLDGIGPQNLHYREPVEFSALSSDDPNFTRLLDGLAGILKVGRGRLIFVQPAPSTLADFSAAEARDAEALRTLVADHAKISAAEQGRNVERRWREINRTRSRWQINRLHSLVLGNLGVRASDNLLARLLEVRRGIPFSPVNVWTYLGPFPPDPAVEDPLATRLDEYLGVRDPQARLRNMRGESVEWVTPTDSQNGMGVGGKMDLARVYGVRVKDLAIARTQLWSTRAREAKVRYGADWWAKLIVNGETVPGEGWGFEREGVMKLRAGWNEVVCVNAAGSNGHWFKFSTTNPGDLVVSQTVLPPANPPTGLPPAERLLPEQADTGFNLYTDPIDGPALDPYDFIPW
jgi:beta-galactosidase